MADQLKPAYLISGDDPVKIDSARARLRARAEREGAALEAFDAPDPSRGPDAAALAAALPALSLTASRRYLLADGVDRWKAGDASTVAEALADPPPDTTIVLIARGKPPAKLVDAVRKAGGDAISYDAPSAREMPRWAVAAARERGFELEPAAARTLVERMGARQTRLAGELDRLSLWAGKGGRVGDEDLASMVADTSEAAVWTLSDAVLEADAGSAVLAGERLLEQGESLTGLIYQLARRLREAHAVALRLEAGEAPGQVQESLCMHPYAARKLLARMRGTDPGALRDAIGAMADLELWTRGGSDYPEDAAFTLALRRACGA